MLRGPEDSGGSVETVSTNKSGYKRLTGSEEFFWTQLRQKEMAIPTYSPHPPKQKPLL